MRSDPARSQSDLAAAPTASASSPAFYHRVPASYWKRLCMWRAKVLLLVTCPACSILILAPLYFGPPNPRIYIAFAIAQPLAAIGFYKLIRRLTLQEVIDLADQD